MPCRRAETWSRSGASRMSSSRGDSTLAGPRYRAVIALSCPSLACRFVASRITDWTLANRLSNRLPANSFGSVVGSSLSSCGQGLAAHA